MDLVMKRFLVPGLITIGSFLVLVVLRTVIFRLLRAWSRKTGSTPGDILLKSFGVPSVYWCLAVGLYIGVDLSDMPLRYARHINKTIDVILVLSFTLATATLVGKIFRNYIQSSDLPIPTTGLAGGIIKGAVYIFGFLIILTILGVSIAPLITALGVGGLAVALALQDTLANLFAGMHILLEKSVRVGDFVRLENGQEGFVDDITWRTTRIRMLPNNMVVIPNKKLSESIVTNYYLPGRQMSVTLSVAVDTDADPDLVERILVEEAKACIGVLPGLLGDPEPVGRFSPGFGAGSLDFTLVCSVGEITDQYLVQHELRKRILRRFRAEGVQLPQKTVILKEEKDVSRPSPSGRL